MNPEQFKNLIQAAAQNPNTPQASEFRTRLESGRYNDTITSMGLKPEQFGYTPPPEPPKEKTLGGKFLNMVSGMPGVGNQISSGVFKSIGGAVQGALDIGGKIGGFVGKNVFGQSPEQAPKAPQVFSPESLQTQNIGETIGKTAGDIAQFFIPGGAEKVAAGKLEGVLDVAKLSSKYGPEASKLIKNLWDIGARGVVTGASTQGVAELQTGGEAGLGYGVAGGLAGSAGKALEIFGPGLSKSIEKANFKLTPSQETKLASKIESGSSFIADNKIYGTEATKYRKLNQLNNSMEDAMQSSIGNDVRVNKQELINEIKNAPENFKTEDPAIYQEVKNDAERAIKTLQETKGKDIGLNDILNGKRSYGQRAFGKATAQIKGSTVVSEGDYSIEQAYQNILDKGMSTSQKSIQIPQELQTYFGGKTEVSLPEFNKVYSQAINAKKFTNAAQFKKDTGLVGRLFGLWAGSAVGEAIVPGLGGKIVGGTLGELASSKVPGIIRNVGQRLTTGGQSTPAIVKTAEGMITPGIQSSP